MKCKTCSEKVKQEAVKGSQFCGDCWKKPFSITDICRLDLNEAFSAEQIALFDDDAMRRLAAQMAGNYHGDDFHDDMTHFGGACLATKKK